jgi:hypothetical protein
MKLLDDMRHMESHFGQPQKSFWMHLMELLGDIRHVESRFCPLGNGVSIGVG